MGSLRRRAASAALLLGVILAALALAPALAGAAETYVAAPYPVGSGSECSETVPCELTRAVAMAKAADAVRLQAGNYVIPVAGLRIERAIDLGGVPGAVPVLETTTTAIVQVTDTAGAATLHDLILKGEGGLALESGSADRIFVDDAAREQAPPDDAACELGVNTTLRDSVCWAHGGEKSSTDGIAVTAFGEGVHGTTLLRNVTAVADDGAGHGLFALASDVAQYSVDGSAVIADSANSADVDAALALKETNPEVIVNLSHSDYATAEEELPRAQVTAPGANANLTAPPLFTAAGEGDFHEAAGSPTIDGGLADSSTGMLDLDGQPRAQPGCFGAAATPDIGAFERAASAPCPPPPPPPIPTVEPPKPQFRIVKVTLHGAGGSIEVETPGAGMLTLTGSGVKLITRASSDAGFVTMPIQPWAITRVRLKRAGETRVRLKVRFAPTSGAPDEKARSVLLKKG